MITAEKLCKRFKLYRSPADRLREIVLRRQYHKDFQALRDVSFQVGAGETLGIIGENGAGKSTLLKVLTGVLMPDSGRLHVDGRITGLLELGTGFNPEFTGRDNIYFNGMLLGIGKAEVDRKLEEIIAFTELGEFIEEPLKTFSSGMVMRLAFAVAIHAEPQAFVVDEALSVGDAYFQQKCMRRIKEFKEGGGSILFVSHDMNAVKVLCDRAILLAHGMVLETGDPERVINSYNFQLARRMGTEDVVPLPDTCGQSYGNQLVRISGIGLEDASGRATELFVSGSPFQICLLVEAREAVDDVTLGILIRDRFGQDIFGTNTYHLRACLPLGKGERTKVTFAFEELNIGPGKYSLTVAAHSADTHVENCHHWIDKALIFEVVQSDNHFVGLSRLKPELLIGHVDHA